MQPTAPIRQTVWGRLAVANFVLGGTGAGGYALAFALPGLLGPGRVHVRAMEIIGALLIAGGLGAVALEAGRPFQGHKVLRHVKRSWMSREALIAAIFFALVAIDMAAPNPLIRGLAAGVGVAFVGCQGVLVMAAKGIPAWRLPAVPWLFLTSGLAKGSGLLLLVHLLIPTDRGTLWGMAQAATWLLALSLSVWLIYLSSATQHAPQEATQKLKGTAVTGWVMGVGHSVPIVLLIAGLYNGPWLPALAGVSAMAILVGGTVLKDTLIVGAGYLVGFGIPSPPSRGGAAGTPLVSAGPQEPLVF